MFVTSVLTRPSRAGAVQCLYHVDTQRGARAGRTTTRAPHQGRPDQEIRQIVSFDDGPCSEKDLSFIDLT